jgi:hypothetical protein
MLVQAKQASSVHPILARQNFQEVKMPIPAIVGSLAAI